MFLLDFDGTLLDSNHVWVEVDLRFLAERGLKPTSEYTDFVAHSIFPVAAEYTRSYYHLPDTAEEIMEQWIALAREAYSLHTPLKPGALTFLKACRNARKATALVTACMPDLCRMALERHGLSGYLDQLIFAQELGLEKRDPVCFLEAARRLGVKPEDCVVLDDSPANCKSAMAAGMTAVGVYDDFFRDSEAEMRAVCRRYVTRLDELDPATF